MTAWVIGLVSAIAAFFAARQYDRIKIQSAVEELGKLRQENKTLLHQVRCLEADLRDAKRAPMSHDDVAERLRELAAGARRGIV